ncbi:hypothetical protein CHS0354_021186 [Potamilus streckersoni]|uniref:non-specific serine/threonine protein kinase n=1 Tax=Potamilus streckersoni TaxID=2493646 RepID=A0AAE0TAX4_9BIVA|nr:hypothetical protein CHS0354_021186 [Potamilus streckersoni]
MDLSKSVVDIFDKVNQVWYKVDLQCKDERDACSLVRKMMAIALGDCLPFPEGGGSQETSEDIKHEIIALLGVSKGSLETISRFLPPTFGVGCKGKVSSTASAVSVKKAKIPGPIENPSSANPSDVVSPCSIAPVRVPTSPSPSATPAIVGPSIPVTSALQSPEQRSCAPLQDENVLDLSVKRDKQVIPSILYMSSPPPVSASKTRAASLLEWGCMPLFPPARREWQEDTAIQIPIGSSVLPWPPKGWKRMNSDQKLLQWKYASMLIENSIEKPLPLSLNRGVLLDKFNMLALPGTSVPMTTEQDLIYRKASYYNYEILRSVAIGNSFMEDSTVERILKLYEASADRRETSTNFLINLIKKAGVSQRLENLFQIISNKKIFPAEVLKMDSRSLQMFKEALNEGKEKVYNIRVMVVGQYGVGKSTLTQRLLGRNVNIFERHSTDGIDVHIECCKVSLKAGEWTTQEKDAEKYSRLQRLVKFLNERAQKQESKTEQEGQSELDGQVTSEEHDNGHPHHDLPVNADPDTNKEVERPTSQPVDSPIARVIPKASSEREEKEKQKDTVMEILQLVNENSGNLEKSMVEYAALALWDFAGQYVFYTTHQTFLTSRAIYLLVIDLSQQITDLIKDDECFLDMEGIKLCKVHDLIEIWMNSIHSCTPSSHPRIPYVILVGTHVDKIPENCRQRVIDEYFIHVCEILSNKPAALHIMDCIAIDNTQDDPRLEQLKKKIFELAKQQPHWGEEKPARWLPLEQSIMTLKASGFKVAPLSLIEEINRSGSVRIENREELDLFLRFQNEMGIILYFSIEGLSEKVVLDPQWLIDAQKSLITAGTFINKTPAIVRKWCEFKKSGILTHELIDAVWSEEKNPEFHDNKDHILLLMEKLNIIARPRAYDQEGKEVKVENYFLAPCMLSDATPRDIITPKPQPEMEITSVLCYVFLEQFLPAPIFHRLLAACVAQWPVAKKNSENLIYCCCCVFDLDRHHRVTVFSRKHVIFVRVTIMGTTGKTLTFQLCTEVKKFISMTLSQIIGNLEQSLQFELHIQCPKSEGDNVDSLFTVSDLQSNVDLPCHSHGDSHVILSSELLRFWFQEQESSNVASSPGPSQPHPTSDTDRFMHITYLLVDVGSRILRKLLCHHTVTPTCTLDQYLANNRNKINSLLKRKVLHQSQMDILFPPSGANTNMDDYDVTLLSALFNNIVPGLNPQEENMIKSLREDRNTLYGHAKSCKMNASYYQTCWNSISSTMTTLSQYCGDPNFQNEILQELQRTQVSAVPTGSYLDILKTWFSKIETAEGSLETVMGSLETAGDAIKTLTARVEALELKKADDES